MMNARTAVVVEDDHDVGDAISKLLDQAGFDVTVARTGTEALTLVAEGRPDLVTLDLTLPDIDGVEVCRQIRTVTDCYVIVVSGRAAEVDRLVGLEVGADDYLVKPFSMRELQARVAALFRRPRSSDPAPEAAAAQLVVDPAPEADPTSSEGCSDLSLNRGAREVRVSGREIDLTRTEFDLLAHLVGTPAWWSPARSSCARCGPATSSPTAPTSSTSTSPTCAASCAGPPRATSGSARSAASASASTPAAPDATGRRHDRP